MSTCFISHEEAHSGSLRNPGGDLLLGMNLFLFPLNPFWGLCPVAVSVQEGMLFSAWLKMRLKFCSHRLGSWFISLIWLPLDLLSALCKLGQRG